MNGEWRFSAYVWVDSGAHEATLQALPFFDAIHKSLCQGFIEEYEFLLTSWTPLGYISWCQYFSLCWNLF